MLQFCLPGYRALMGRGATVAQRTLDPYILVRIRTPQPGILQSVMSDSDDDPLCSNAAAVPDEHRSVRFTAAMLVISFNTPLKFTGEMV